MAEALTAPPPVDDDWDDDWDDADSELGEELVKQGSVESNTGGYVTIYSTRDGRPSEVLAYMLPWLKKQRDPLDPSKRAFSRKPLVEYKTGQYPCYLHRDHPMQPYLQSLGVTALCPSQKMLSTLQEVRRHMRSRHKDEWAVLEDAEVEKERDEERTFRREQLEYFRLQKEAMTEVPLAEDIKCTDCGWVPRASKSPTSALTIHKTRWCPNRKGAK